MIRDFNTLLHAQSTSTGDSPDEPKLPMEAMEMQVEMDLMERGRRMAREEQCKAREEERKRCTGLPFGSASTVNVLTA